MNLPRSSCSARQGNSLFDISGATLQDEAGEIDKEETEWFDNLHEISSFGYNTLIPLGKQQTQSEDQEASHHPTPSTLLGQAYVDTAAVLLLWLTPSFRARA